MSRVKRKTESSRRTGKSRLILMIGGASSGKSAAALRLTDHSVPRAFVATGQPLDDEMAERIQRHRASRDAGWETAEVPVELADWFRSKGQGYLAIVLDCLTLWLNNLRDRGVRDSQVPAKVDELLRAIRTTSATVVVVTNELGLGLVPVSPSIRKFRDLAGQVNQQVAAEADEVYFIISGQALRLK